MKVIQLNEKMNHPLAFCMFCIYLILLIVNFDVIVAAAHFSGESM